MKEIFGREIAIGKLYVEILIGKEEIYEIITAEEKDYSLNVILLEKVSESEYAASIQILFGDRYSDHEERMTL